MCKWYPYPSVRRKKTTWNHPSSPVRSSVVPKWHLHRRDLQRPVKRSPLRPCLLLFSCLILLLLSSSSNTISQVRKTYNNDKGTLRKKKKKKKTRVLTCWVSLALLSAFSFFIRSMRSCSWSTSRSTFVLFNLFTIGFSRFWTYTIRKWWLCSYDGNYFPTNRKEDENSHLVSPTSECILISILCLLFEFYHTKRTRSTHKFLTFERHLPNCHISRFLKGMKKGESSIRIWVHTLATILIWIYLEITRGCI